MTADTRPSLLLQRFRQSPVLPRETWQGGLVRLPAWIEGGANEEPFRPWGAIWVSLSTGRMTVKPEEARDAHGPGLLFDALLQFAQQERKILSGRASRVLVADAPSRDYLERAIGDTGVSVEIVPRLDAVDAVLRDYTDYVIGHHLPGALEGAGVTVDVMRRFAEAAARFYRAAQWQHLTNDDLIQIESEVPSPSYRYAVVLGNAGRTFGIGFYKTPEDYYAVAGAGSPRKAAGAVTDARSVLFDAADGIPFDDCDLWTDHRLPLAGPRAYPFAAHYHGGTEISRPGREEVTFLEAVLRALAETTEDEMDAGRWTRTVFVDGRATDVRLALPDVLEPSVSRARIGAEFSRRASERVHAEIGRFLSSHEFANLEEANAALAEHFGMRPIDQVPSTASTPLERAQELCYEAYDSVGRRRMVLAKRALALSPDCAEAYVILAEHASTRERSLELYEQGIAAGRRAIGDAYDGLVGEFWGQVTTRPYMRACMGRAGLLEQLGRRDEAIAEYQELLRLNPSDNQGARYLLVALLLEAGRDDEAGRLFESYPDDVAASFRYAEVLWSFRRHGDGPETRPVLAQALKINPHAPEYLLAPDLADEAYIDHFRLGSKDEAIVCASEIGKAWQMTPGALDWLRAQAHEQRKAKAAAARRARRRRQRGRG